MKFFYLLLFLPFVSFSQSRNDTISIISNKKNQAIVFLKKKYCSMCFAKIEKEISSKYDTSEVDFYFAWMDDADTIYAKRNQQLLNNNFARLKIKQHIFIERHTYLINGHTEIIAPKEYRNLTPYSAVVVNNELEYYFP